ncbi:MAG TPA: RidA family protein [Acidobacteriota bacterium]|nr:RidA family protein [Acidobacteriota bacterium]
MAGNTMYLSGFSGFVPPLGYITDDIQTQTHFALRNILDCLQAAGMGWGNLVSINAYLGNLDQIHQVMEVYRRYFPKDPPALTIMQQSPDNPDNRPLIQFSGIAVRSSTE